MAGSPDLFSSKITCETFAVLLNTQPPPMVLDLRSFLAYNQGHVKGAINVCIPKTLARRHAFSEQSIESGIWNIGEKRVFCQRTGAVIVLCDQRGAEHCNLESLLCKCLAFLAQEALCQHVYWLEGGLLEFQTDFPDNIQTSLIGECSQALLTPKPREVLSSITGPLTTPILARPLLLLEDPIIKILDHLFLSGSAVAGDYDTLKKSNVVNIINCAAELPDLFRHTKEFTYRRLELQDTPVQRLHLVNILEETFKGIDEARIKGSGTLIHCLKGRSRSASVVIAYLMRTFAWSFRDAYDYVQHKSSKISPNLGFVGQLLSYEAILKERREQPT